MLNRDDATEFRQPSSQPGMLKLWLTALLAGFGSAANSEEAVPAAARRAPLAVWDTTIRATVAGGYRDNVLSSSVAPESSAFVASTAEASFIRLSESGAQVILFLLGEDTRFADAPAVEQEQLLSGSAQFLKPVGTRDELGGRLLYLYQNQVLDVSDSEANLYRVLVKGHGFTVQPYWNHSLGRGWSAQLEGAMLRQLYEHELDGFWEAGGRLGFLYRYGHKSEFSFGYQFRQRLYDTRNQFDHSGVAVPNTSLIYNRHEFAGEWRHYWDTGRHWLTATKAGVLLNRDNGSGYFDYDRVLFAQQLRWRNYGWEIKAGGRLGWYFHRVQLVAGERRERSYYALDLRAEKRLGKHWLLYTAAGREWNFSNEPLDEYNDWTASSGIGVEF